MIMKPLLSNGWVRLRRAARGALLCAWLPSAALADNTGLWVGMASVNQVNQPAVAPGTLLPAGGAFSYRLILHVDTNSTTRLLQRVVTVGIPTGNLATNLVTGVVSTNGSTVLLSDESLVPAQLQTYPNAAVRRISSVNFLLMAPQVMNGQFGSTGQLSCTLQVPYDDPVNPFVTAYSPLHDNLQVQNGVTTKLPEGVQSFSVTRNLTLVFSAQDASNPTNPNWGITQIGGTLQEEVDGLYRPLVSGVAQSIQVSGTFRLQQVSTNGTLVTP